MTELDLNIAEKKVLLAVLKSGGSTKPNIIKDMFFKEIVEVMNTSSWLKQKGLVNIDEKKEIIYSLTDEGKRYAEYGLPERRLLVLELCRNATVSKVSEEEMKIALMWLKKKGFADISKDNVTGIVKVSPNEMGKNYFENNLQTPDELVLKTLKDTIEVPASLLDRKGLDMLLGRKGILIQKDVIERTISLTNEGQQVAMAIIEKNEKLDEDDISQLTPELLQSGKWKGRKIRKYHVQSFAPAIHGARRHPLRELMDEIRDIFIEMGFTEIEYDYIQPCFWNMDALFIPQDHPARDIQDTYFLKNPSTLEIKNAEYIEKVRAVHENGGNTGSDGWKYVWNINDAKKAVLRTHTTVNTIRYLSEHPDPPVKVFSIGRIFRNEATDATHLSELFQIEGIVMEEGTSAAMLIGTLKEFYKRIGFPEVMVTTSYYPYTEPSMDVAVKFKGRILELGGAGIFRPEVIAPFGVKHNVLAWGLGLERLAMIKWGIQDIRQVTSNDMEFLRTRKIHK